MAVVHPYWTFWEHTIPPELRASRMALARRVAAALEPVVDVVAVEELADPEAGAALGAVLGADARTGPSVAAVVVLQTMAVPPTHALALLDALPDAGIVVWAAHERGVTGDEVDHRLITSQGATVGAPMLTNVLARRGRPFELLLGRVDDPAALARVRDGVAVAAAAGAVRRGRIGRVGAPLDGYVHVDLDAAALRRATGLEVVTVDASEVLERYREVPDVAVRALGAEVDAAWDVAGDARGDALERSLRAALALERLVADHRLDAGALNCHVPEIRFGDEIGVTPCWGLGRLTSLGVPWTCTGDLLTAVAMLVTKRLGGAAVYHELESLDYETGELVVANSGEHDLAWLAPGERPRLGRNGWFCGRDPRCGVCAVFEPPPGPATLVAFTPHPDAVGGFRLVAARGELTARRFPATGTVNGAFRFADGPAAHAWERWARTGVNHHSAATPGDLSGRVAGVARHLRIDAALV